MLWGETSIRLNNWTYRILIPGSHSVRLRLSDEIKNDNRPNVYFIDLDIDLSSAKKNHKKHSQRWLLTGRIYLHN